jgi:hypothetical protein
MLLTSLTRRLALNFLDFSLEQGYWFLNIRIIRDRQQRKLWLCQDAYIDKIVKTYNLEHSAKAATSLSVSRKDLIKFDGQTDPQHVHAYQRRIGSVIYLAVITRPDIALAVFLTNPSPRHRAEADRIISYLRDTKYVAIEYSANGIHQASIKTYPHETRHPVFEASSDAAFGDDPDTRRRSEGFLFRLFGGPVDWKATRQPHITTLRLKPNYWAFHTQPSRLFGGTDQTNGLQYGTWSNYSLR